MSKPRMIIDTDPGHDDAIALILADKFAEIVGVTTVAGNTSLDHTTNNALRILELIGNPAEVFAGESAPLRGKGELATDVHGSDGLGGIDLPNPSRSASSIHAVEYLLDAVEPDIWVVAVGPLTNIARVIERDPSWVDRIAGLTIMGGSATVGNVTPAAEFNLYFDPEAASVIFNSGAKVRMCGLNLTLQIQISTEDLDAIERNPAENKLHDFADQNFARVFERLYQMTGEASLALHDPCAVLAVSHPKLFTFFARNVQVELDGKLTRGMTVIDKRKRAEPLATNVDVGYGIQVDKVKPLVLDALYPI